MGSEHIGSSQAEEGLGSDDTGPEKHIDMIAGGTYILIDRKVVLDYMDKEMLGKLIVSHYYCQN